MPCSVGTNYRHINFQPFFSPKPETFHAPTPAVDTEPVMITSEPNCLLGVQWLCDGNGQWYLVLVIVILLLLLTITCGILICRCKRNNSNQPLDNSAEVDVFPLLTMKKQVFSCLGFLILNLILILEISILMFC